MRLVANIALWAVFAALIAVSVAEHEWRQLAEMLAVAGIVLAVIELRRRHRQLR